MTMTAMPPSALADVVRSEATLRTFLHGLPGVDQVGADARAAMLGTRSIKTSAKSFAIDQAGEIAKARYSRLVEEMQDLSNQIDTVEIEVLNFERGQIGQELQAQMTAASESTGGDVYVSPEHNVWPFNGEYWRDELGYYRQQVTYLCGR